MGRHVWTPCVTRKKGYENKKARNIFFFKKVHEKEMGKKEREEKKAEFTVGENWEFIL